MESDPRGDPAPEKIAAQAIAALATVVAPPAGKTAGFEVFQKQFENLGVQVKGPELREAQVHRVYCFTFKGQVFCIELPVVAPHPQQ